MKAIGYVRVSTKMQVDKNNSIGMQKRKIASYCKTHDLDLVEITEDLGVSGMKSDRQGFKSLISKVIREEIDVVVVWSLSRLGRNLKEMLEVVENFKRWGISLRTIKENLGGDDSVSELVFNIMGSINQFESKQLGERISTIKQDKKKQAKSYGRAQYGYINVEGKIFVNKTEMAARKYAERMRMNGFSWKMIADTLYDDGVRSRKGTRLFASTLRNMFQFTPPKVEGEYNG